MVVQNIDGIDYELQEPFDMSFLSSCGKVFKVFDKQDSGCICFGVQNKDVRIHIFEDILAFHKFVLEMGYVAIDFYDGSIMYDFKDKNTIICDIDCYSKMPYITQ